VLTNKAFSAFLLLLLQVVLLQLDGVVGVIAGGYFCNRLELPLQLRNHTQGWDI
jgi:hypothetical protein